MDLQANRPLHTYLATPIYVHLLCGAISFVFTFLLSRILHFVLQQPFVTVPQESTQQPHLTLIEHFVLVFQEEFASSATPSDTYLFRFCGVLLYTLYSLVVTFALSFSALFHSFSFIFFVWRKWIALCKGLYGVWNNEGAICGIW